MYKILILFLLCLLPLHAEQTLAIIKPDAVSAHHTGDILARYEKNGFRIAGLKMIRLSDEQARQFYAEHKERHFFPELVSFVTSGPIVVVVLDRDQAVAKNRDLIGSTDPKQAAPGTLRADFGTSRGNNAVHGSDGPEAAKREIAFFFTSKEML